MTRAKQELYLITASSRMLYGGLQHNPPSRFLADVDGALMQNSQGANEPYEFNQLSADEPRYVPRLEEGDNVRHQLFGKGTVMAVEGEEATIKFSGRIVKKLNLAFAPLEKL